MQTAGIMQRMSAMAAAAFMTAGDTRTQAWRYATREEEDQWEGSREDWICLHFLG